MFRKTLFIPLLILLTLLMSTFSVLAEDDLTGYKYESQMRELIDLGIIAGYPDGTYKPERTVTRAEFAKFVVASFELQSEQQVPNSETAATEDLTFTDVDTKKWFAPWIADAVHAGVVSGYPDGSFKPNALITREQMAAMVARALKAKGIVEEGEQVSDLTFKDATKIHPAYLDDVKLVAHYKVINGDGRGYFDPQGSSERWMVALVMLNGRDIVFVEDPKAYQVASVKTGTPEVVKQFDTFEEAKNVAAAGTSLVVQRDGIIVWIKEGMAVSNKYTFVFPDTTLAWKGGSLRLRQFRPFIDAHSQMKFVDATEEYVLVELAGEMGYVEQTTLNLIPNEMNNTRSYYIRSGDHLVHYIYNYEENRFETPGRVGVAPKEFVTGQNYYSWDGLTFTDMSGKFVTEAHQYFNKLTLRTKTSYTAEELDRYLQEAFPYYNKEIHEKFWTDSPLVGIGKDLKAIEAERDINALYLMAHAIHESQWGTSPIAQDKNNLFGSGAFDSDAYKNALTYDSYKESIEDTVNKVVTNYQLVQGDYYNGSFLGNKSQGMNVRYASDPFWGEKIAGHMYRADLLLGKKDIFKETLYMTAAETGPPIYFRRDASTNYASLYALPENGLTVSVKETIDIPNAINWFRVVPEERTYTNAYVRSDLLKLIPLAE